jgi:RNase P/RNase MRP subunit p29
MSKLLSKTKAHLEALGYPKIGVELRSGLKHFGRVVKFTQHTIYLKTKNGDVLDVPRRIIARAFLLLEGEKTDGEAAAVSGENKH